VSDEGEEEEGSEGEYEDEEEGEEEGEGEGNCALLTLLHCAIAPDALVHPDQLQLLTTYSPGPPVHKKRKTENGANGKKVEGEDEEEEEEEEPEGEGEGEGEDEDADDTAETSGPAAAAAKAKGGVVPKESALAEVDDAEEEE
jgi:hypothetical protein